MLPVANVTTATFRRVWARHPLRVDVVVAPLPISKNASFPRVVISASGMLISWPGGWYRLIAVVFSIATWYVSGQTIFDFARHVTHKAEGFLDELKLGLKTLRYGLNTVEGVLKESKDAECAYKCPNGLLAKPKSGYKPIPNGCGSYGLKFDESGLPHKDMNSCCNRHDICYGTCLASKDDCDSKFLGCLDSVCDKKTGKNHKDKLMSCKAAARALYAGSQYLGCKAFKDAQRQACFCNRKDEL